MQDAANKQRKRYKWKLAKLKRNGDTSSEEGEWTSKSTKHTKTDSSESSENESYDGPSNYATPKQRDSKTNFSDDDSSSSSESD